GSTRRARARRQPEELRPRTRAAFAFGHERTVAGASQRVQGDSWPRHGAGSPAELADVAHAQGDARAVAPVEEGDRELAARPDEVAEDRRRDLAVRAAVRRQH